jgi:hypothetical protein
LQRGQTCCNILEAAARIRGVTRELMAVLPNIATITANDLNEPMHEQMLQQRHALIDVDG